MSSDNIRSGVLKSSLIASGIFILIALLFLSIGIYLVAKMNVRVAGYTPTTAVVVSYDFVKNDSRGIPIYVEVVEFTIDEELYKVAYIVTYTPEDEIGTELTVYYNPDNPEDYKFADRAAFLYYILIAFASLIIIIFISFSIKEIYKYRTCRY